MTEFFKLLIQKEPPSDRLRAGAVCGAAGIAFNLTLFVIKLFAGIISGSLSVAADALNNLSDASSSIVSLIGFKLSGVKADSEHPFGHARAEYLSALAVAMLIILIGFELLRSSVVKILHPAPVVFTPIVFAILLISIAVKLFMMIYNRRIGRLINSNTLIATACDSRNDCLTTLGVLSGGFLSRAFSLNLDGFIGALVAVFITVSGISLIRATVTPLLGAAPPPELVGMIKDKILSYPSVLGAHDLIIHDYGPSRRFASVHVEMPAEKNIVESHDTIDQIERDFLAEYNINLVIHLDPIITEETKVSSLRRRIAEIAASIDPLCTIHDLRIVASGNVSLIVFDCLKPPSCKLSDETVSDIFSSEIGKINPGYKVSVKIDQSFFAAD